MKRHIKRSDLVYWVEYDRDDEGKFCYYPHKGYYLATYTLNDEEIDIVTLGSITSCVVRHLKSNELFSSKEEVEKYINSIGEKYENN